MNACLTSCIHYHIGITNGTLSSNQQPFYLPSSSSSSTSLSFKSSSSSSFKKLIKQSLVVIYEHFQRLQNAHRRLFLTHLSTEVLLFFILLFIILSLFLLLISWCHIFIILLFIYICMTRWHISSLLKMLERTQLASQSEPLWLHPHLPSSSSSSSSRPSAYTSASESDASLSSLS